VFGRDMPLGCMDHEALVPQQKGKSLDFEVRRRFRLTLLSTEDIRCMLVLCWGAVTPGRYIVH